MTTAGEGPENDWALHDCGYAPLLTGGRLVKKHDPAWQMAEKTRAVDCLTELVRVRAVKTPLHQRPGPGYSLSFMHSHESTREYPGFPDCDITGDRGHLVAELKRMGEFPSPAQVVWLTRKHRAGQSVRVWWPCCWYSGRIDRELAELAGLPLLGGCWSPGLPPQPGQAGYVPPGPELLMRRSAAHLEARADAEARAHLAAAVAPRGAAQRADTLAPRTAPDPKGTTMTAPAITLPGEPTTSPHLLEGATGFTMALHMMGGETCAKVEEWLRANGFPPAIVPFPVAVVVGEDRMAVCCSLGPGPGAPRNGVVREWRVVPIAVEPPIGLMRDIDAAGGKLSPGADKVKIMMEGLSA